MHYKESINCDNNDFCSSPSLKEGYKGLFFPTYDSSIKNICCNIIDTKENIQSYF